MFLRALLAFLVLPGLFAGVLPLVIVMADSSRGEGSAIGVPVLILGLIVLLWCVRDFYVAGKGTLAPWAPPRNLVRVGLYRSVRNPMYIGVLLIVLGVALAGGSPAVAIYVFLLAIGFHLRVLRYEEPWLEATFGSAWETYRANVPRWIPKRPQQ